MDCNTQPIDTQLEDNIDNSDFDWENMSDVDESEEFKISAN
jgi:hypothetical protein